MSPAVLRHAGFDQFLGTAATDPAFQSTLLANPRDAALRFGLSAGDAAMVADIRAADLRAFATELLPRLAGRIAGVDRRAGALVG